MADKVIAIKNAMWIILFLLSISGCVYMVIRNIENIFSILIGIIISIIIFRTNGKR